MSTDALRREIDGHLSRIAALRRPDLPPVTCVLARREVWPDGDKTPVTLTDALLHPTSRVCEPCHMVTSRVARRERCAIAFSRSDPPADLLEAADEEIRHLMSRGESRSRCGMRSMWRIAFTIP